MGIYVGHGVLGSNVGGVLGPLVVGKLVRSSNEISSVAVVDMLISLSSIDIDSSSAPVGMLISLGSNGIGIGITTVSIDMLITLIFMDNDMSNVSVDMLISLSSKGMDRSIAAPTDMLISLSTKGID